MLSNRENLRAALEHGSCEFLPTILHARAINTPLCADNIARGTVRDANPRTEPGPEGAYDAFGVKWVWDPVLRGSMEDPNTPHLLTDVSDWRDVITFPNPDEWDWASQVELNREYMADSEALYKTTVFTGFFERLISFMGFEEAAVSMIDEDCEDDVRALFERLADYYICYLKNVTDNFAIELVEIHDDWGSQTATFFSEDTLRSMIIPSLTRFCDFAHERGLFVELHSCGKIENFVPVMIDAGVDMWMGQDQNDKAACHTAYGDKIVIESEIPELGESATDEEIDAAAKKFVDTFVAPGKTTVLSVYSYAHANRPEFLQKIEALAAEKLAQN